MKTPSSIALGIRHLGLRLPSTMVITYANERVGQIADEEQELHIKLELLDKELANIVEAEAGGAEARGVWVS